MYNRKSIITGILVEQENQYNIKHCITGKNRKPSRKAGQVVEQKTYYNRKPSITGNLVERTTSRKENLLLQETQYNRKEQETQQKGQLVEEKTYYYRKPSITGKNRKPSRTSNLVQKKNKLFVQKALLINNYLIQIGSKAIL